MKKFILLLSCVFLINSCSKEDLCEPKPTMGSTTLNEAGYSSISVTGSITPPTCDTSVISQGFVLDDEQLPTINKRKKIANGTSIQATFDDLLPNTTYYIRTFLTNVDGDYYGPQVEIKTQNPTVSFSDVGVEQSFESASFSAKYSFAEGAGLNVKEKGFEVDGKTYRDTDSANGLINITVENLSTNKSYDYNAYVITDYGNYYSDIKSFNTNDPSSTVSNLTIENILFDSADFTATYENNYSGTDITSEKGFIISINEDFSNSTKHKSDTDSKTFKLSKADLSSGKKYYLKAYVENPYGTYTSESSSFETLEAGYSFTNTFAESIEYDVASLFSEYAQKTGDKLDIEEKGFYYSENEDMTQEIKIISGVGDGIVGVDLQNLVTANKYYYQAYITNEYGTWRSEVSNFVTKSAVPNFSFDVIDESIWFDKTKANFSMTKPDDVSITSFNIDIKNLNSEEITRINYLENYSDYSGGAFEYEMTNLHPNTNYTVTMILVNPYGTFESDNYSFNTKDDTPSLKSFLGQNNVITEHQVLFQYNIKEVQGDIPKSIYLKYKNTDENDYIRVNLPLETNSTTNWEVDNQQITLNDIVMGPEYEYILHYENEWNTHTVELFETKAVTYKVGDIKFGGVIVYIDATGYHGLIAAEPDKYVKKYMWSNDRDSRGGLEIKDNTEEDGALNTNKILDYYSKISASAPAAEYCDGFSKGGFSDWYLPSWDEARVAQPILWNKYGSSIMSEQNVIWTSNTDPILSGRALGAKHNGCSANNCKHPQYIDNELYTMPMRKF